MIKEVRCTWKSEAFDFQIPPKHGKFKSDARDYAKRKLREYYRKVPKGVKYGYVS